MTLLGRLLESPRAQDAPVLRTVMSPPWSVLLADDAPLTLLVVERGDAVVRHPEADLVHLGPGDAAVVRGDVPWVLADDAGTRPQVRVDPGQACSVLDDGALGAATVTDHHGVRTWGNDPHGATAVLSGVYESHTQVGRFLLDALPPVVVVRRDRWTSPLPSLLVAETTRDAPGQEVVLDRLLDAVLTSALREWATHESSGPFAVATDPEVARALHLLHEHPARPWTVADLARAVGLSRAALARRFTAVVGSAPMAYLTAWRMALAADLLRDPTTTLATVAGRVGYATPFALSAAFRRTYGVSPSEHRRRTSNGAADPGWPAGPRVRTHSERDEGLDEQDLREHAEREEGGVPGLDALVGHA